MMTDDKRTIRRLREDGNEFFNKILLRDTRGLFFYSKDKLNGGWSLSDVYERTMAAQALGFNVIVEADEKGLHFKYAKKLPTCKPWSF